MERSRRRPVALRKQACAISGLLSEISFDPFDEIHQDPQAIGPAPEAALGSDMTGRPQIDPFRPPIGRELLCPIQRDELIIMARHQHGWPIEPVVRNDLLHLEAHRLGRGVAWLDSGTHDSLLEAANFIATIEHRQGLKIACLEEIAFQKGYVSAEQLSSIVESMPKSGYREYVEGVLAEGVPAR